jgi:hypothetical protein
MGGGGGAEAFGVVLAALEEKLRKQPLAGLLDHWRKHVPKNESLFQYLSDVREERNLLAHRLFRDPRFKTSDDYASEISRIRDRMRNAQYLICGHNPTMTALLDAQWGITNEDRKAQPGARANDHSCHDPCLRTARASGGRGSSLTFGKIVFGESAAVEASESDSPFEKMSEIFSPLDRKEFKRGEAEIAPRSWSRESAVVAARCPSEKNRALSFSR